MKKIILVAAVAIATAFPGFAHAGGITLAPRLSIYADAKDAALKNPEGLACDDKMLVVSDTGNGRLVKYSIDDSGFKALAEIKLPQLPYPTRVELNSKGEIMVLDGRLKKVARLSQTGEFKGYIEPKGLPFSGTVEPTGFKLDHADNMYLTDISSGKVIVTDPDGKFLRSVDYPKGAGFISDLYIDSGGRLFILDSASCQVFVCDKEGAAFTPFTKSLSDYISYPTYMTEDDRGNMLLVDEHGGGIIIVGQDGSFQGRQLSLGWTEGLLYYPEQICVSPKGMAFIADRGNNRVGVFSVLK